MMSEDVREVALIPGEEAELAVIEETGQEDDLAVIEQTGEDDDLAVIEQGEELALIPEDQGDLENQGDQVESVLNRRVVDGKTQYLVKWLGYETTENSWEPEENLYNCQEKV